MSDRPTCVLALAGDRKPDDVVAAVASASSMFSPDASLWLWMRGRYDNGSLSMAAWKAIASLRKSDGWMLRNEVVFACKTADPAPENRLKRGHENLYHLSRGMSYYYDRTMGLGTRGVLGRNNKGSIRTRSGVVGSRYSAQIGRSPFLTDEEKANAWKALGMTCEAMQRGEVSDFRMFIRGVQVATRSAAANVERNGFHISTTKTHSEMVCDFWSRSASETCDPVPQTVLYGIVRLSCPVDGVVLDLFPTPVADKAVTKSGRGYVAVGVGRSPDHAADSQPSLFDPEDVSHATSDAQQPAAQDEELQVGPQQGT